ncbi:hypothetical protein BOTBODRAFT_26402 [Botryobasidium botryosum FD-172 SS1]|uniref:RIC1 C-terminal alpha solenoid region domain-containing protein n=1 Tax=Botryobasidium botryosum (strain FD-172 SS1) TaxID=930990 RepID=A0A067N0D8_BOTB1|nr:hypothetical protein BOTBODRAFT_26402 [Botryobasidium botryosum FD-172 SS1]
MYFPTAAARQLSPPPLLSDSASPDVNCICPNPRKSLFLTLTRDGVTVWRVRPSAVLAHLARTPVSLELHGENKTAKWSPDGNRIVIQSATSYLILITVTASFSSPPYQTPPLSSSSQRHFLPGAGEAYPLQSVTLGFEGVVRIEGDILCISPRNSHILFSTQQPAAVQRIPWPSSQPKDPANEVETETGQRNSWLGHDTWLFSDDELPWLLHKDVTVTRISYSRATATEAWVTSDGRAYFVHLSEDTQPANASISELGTSSARTISEPGDGNVTPNRSTDNASGHHQPNINWNGTCIHGFVHSAASASAFTSRRESDRGGSGSGRSSPASPASQDDDDPGFVAPVLPESQHARVVAINAKFTLVAVGTDGGSIVISNYPLNGVPPQQTQTLSPPTPHPLAGRPRVPGGTGPVRAMEWSSDGYVLAVGWERGWAVWSVGGRCLAWGLGVGQDDGGIEDTFMNGVIDLFWIPGNSELFVLAHPSEDSKSQLFSLPFAKSAVTGQHSPDNTRYAFLQMDDRVLVYRGADQPDMSVINPESDVWQQIKIPAEYLAANWPIRYASISNDGRLVAVAGRRGLVHYSAASGRWKQFSDPAQEQAFTVRGGLIWFHHVLIASVDAARSYQIRLYSRDLELSNRNVIARELLSAPIVLVSLVDNSLLVYTADNTLLHYLIVPTQEEIRLHLCGSISFDGVVAVPSVVRGMSWMIPPGQKRLGDPVDDLLVATILLLVGGKLVLLRPRKVGSHEVKYDMQILADRIEFCWIHLRGIGTLENSLWGYDGTGIRVWLDALTIEANTDGQSQRDVYENVKESVNIPLDFYPLSVLMDKGIIIGAEHETASRGSLSFVMFRILTSSHLFLHHVLLHHLGRGQVREAVLFASHYEHLVFFSHALEILLHMVLEDEADLDYGPQVTNGDSTSLVTQSHERSVLPVVVEFLDHFDAALEVIVGCARKTEVARWRRLFDIVGNPKSLFETCLSSNLLKTAGSYLLVLHNLEQLDESNSDGIRLLRRAIGAKDWTLCKELLRFFRSIDDTGEALTHALKSTDLLGLEDELKQFSF